MDDSKAVHRKPPKDYAGFCVELRTATTKGIGSVESAKAALTQIPSATEVTITRIKQSVRAMVEVHSQEMARVDQSILSLGDICNFLAAIVTRMDPSSPTFGTLLTPASIQVVLQSIFGNIRPVATSIEAFWKGGIQYRGKINPETWKKEKIASIMAIRKTCLQIWKSYVEKCVTRLVSNGKERKRVSSELGEELPRCVFNVCTLCSKTNDFMLTSLSWKCLKQLATVVSISKPLIRSILSYLIKETSKAAETIRSVKHQHSGKSFDKNALEVVFKLARFHLAQILAVLRIPAFIKCFTGSVVESFVKMSSSLYSVTSCHASLSIEAAKFHFVVQQISSLVHPYVHRIVAEYLSQTNRCSFFTVFCNELALV
jgi:hypothetical protein